MECPVCGKSYERSVYYDKSGKGRWREGPAHGTCSRRCGWVLRRGQNGESFWAKVDASGGPDACHPWTGSCDRESGYGIAGWEGRVWKAHRLAFKLSDDSFDEKLDVLHSCDNRPCCNRRHLLQGTHADNMEDMAVKGRSGRMKLSNEDVRRIRQAHQAGFRQIDLADRFGVAQPTISHILSGKRRKHIA